MRIHPASPAQLSEIRSREWIPVRLIGDAIPNVFTNIPENLVESVYASGTFDLPDKLPANVPIPSGELIGGIDIYRNAPDDPVELNKDWYPVVLEPGTDHIYIVTGYKPETKDQEHWLDEVPKRLQGATVIGIKKVRE